MGLSPLTAMGDFIQSNPGSRNTPKAHRSYPLTFNAGALYLQDDWKASENLTLSFGLRYEIQSQPINGLHDFTVQRESNPATAFWDQSLPLSLRTVQSLPMVKHNFGPVVGFAWQPAWQGSDTVVRGGFHIGYDATFNNPFSNIAQSTPAVNFANLQTCQNCVPSDGRASTLRGLINPQVPLGVNPGFRAESKTDPKLRNPYTEQWNIGMQQAFTSHVVGEVRYLGNHGVALYQTAQREPRAGPAHRCRVPERHSQRADSLHHPQLTRLHGWLRGLQPHQCDHSGQHRLLELQRPADPHLGRALAWRNRRPQLHLEQDIDNVTEIYATGAGGNTTDFAQNPFDLNNAERGISGLDYPQLTSFYMIFDVPFFQARTRWGASSLADGR